MTTTAITIQTAGLVVGVRVLLAARRQEAGLRAARSALVVAVATFLAGVATMLTGSGWLSFLMAVGFLADAVLYVVTFVLGGRTLPQIGSAPLP